MTMVGGIIETFNEIIDDITGEAGKWADIAFNWGSDLIQSFIDGLLDFEDEIKEATGGIAQWIKDVLGVGSNAKTGPLSNLTSWGPNLVKTYASGIRSAIPELRRASEEMAGAIGGGGSPTIGGGGFGRGMSINALNVTVNAGGTSDPANLAREVSRELAIQLRRIS